MSAADSKTLQIAPATPRQRPAALALVFHMLEPRVRTAQVEQLLLQGVSDETLFDGLLVAERGGQIVGAVWMQLQPGATAFLRAPRLVGDENPHTGWQLLEAAIKLAQGRMVQIVQSLVELDTGEEARWLQIAGLAYFADLLYLVSLERTFPSDPPGSALEFEPFRESQRGRLGDVIQRTYIQTLDCPQLGGVRDIEDVLDGYRSTGSFDPARWLLVRHNRQDVGCLLLAAHPEVPQWELVYLGLVPEARGQGFGLEITRYAQWLARLADQPRLVLAVDALNAPALAMYAAAGFVAWDRRSVFLRTMT